MVDVGSTNGTLVNGCVRTSRGGAQLCFVLFVPLAVACRSRVRSPRWGRSLIEAEVPVNVKSGDVIMCGETELVLTVTKL